MAGKTGETEIIERASERFLAGLDDALALVDNAARIVSVVKLSPDVISEVGGLCDFHRVRGGAGFFGFKRLEKEAERVEKLLRDLELGSSVDLEEIEGQLGLFRKAVEELIELRAERSSVDSN